MKDEEDIKLVKLRNIIRPILILDTLDCELLQLDYKVCSLVLEQFINPIEFEKPIWSLTIINRQFIYGDKNSNH